MVDEFTVLGKSVIRKDAVEKAKGMGEYYGMEALQSLGCLQNNPHSQALRDLVRRVLDRES